MVTINLSNSPQAAHEESTRRFFLNGGVIFSIVLILLSVLGWLGTNFYADKLVKERDQVMQDIESFRGGAANIEADRTADFGKRMDYIVKEYESDLNPAESLDNIAKAIVSGVYVDSAKYDSVKNQYILSLSGPSFSSLAQQMDSFKKSENFDGKASVASSSAGAEGGGAEAVPTLTIDLPLGK